MERVLLRYGSGIALRVGIARLTHRAVVLVKDLSVCSESRLRAPFYRMLHHSLRSALLDIYIAQSCTIDSFELEGKRSCYVSFSDISSLGLQR